MERRKRHSPSEIVAKLRVADQVLESGGSLREVLRQLQISEPTYHRWRNQYGGLKAEERVRLKSAEESVVKLQRTVADQEQNVEALRAMMRHLLRSPEDRRSAVSFLVDRFGLSERRACECVGQNRSTQRYRGRADGEEGAEDSEGTEDGSHFLNSPALGPAADDPRDADSAETDRSGAQQRSELSRSAPERVARRAWEDEFENRTRSPANSEE